MNAENIKKVDDLARGLRSIGGSSFPSSADVEKQYHAALDACGLENTTATEAMFMRGFGEGCQAAAKAVVEVYCHPMHRQQARRISSPEPRTLWNLFGLL